MVIVTVVIVVANVVLVLVLRRCVCNEQSAPKNPNLQVQDPSIEQFPQFEHGLISLHLYSVVNIVVVIVAVEVDIFLEQSAP